MKQNGIPLNWLLRNSKFKFKKRFSAEIFFSFSFRFVFMNFILKGKWKREKGRGVIKGPSRRKFSFFFQKKSVKLEKCNKIPTSVFILVFVWIREKPTSCKTGLIINLQRSNNAFGLPGGILDIKFRKKYFTLKCLSAL